MITQILLDVLFRFFGMLLLLLPGYPGLPTEVNEAIETFAEAMNGLNSLLPIDTLIQILGITLTIEGAIFLWRAINWTINKVRGSG